MANVSALDNVNDEFSDVLGMVANALNGFVRKLVTYMMEDPRTISASLDLLFVAKAIERIGDHAKNIAEFVIYVVKGADVRHTALTEIEKAVQ